MENGADNNNTIRLFRVPSLTDAVYTRYCGEFGRSEWGEYVAELGGLEHMKIRVLDLYKCSSVALDVEELAAEIELLDTHSAHDEMDVICCHPDFVNEVATLISVVNDRCKHRMSFVTDPRRIDQYRPPVDPKPEAEDGASQSASLAARFASSLDKMKALGIDVEDDAPAPEPETAEADFDVELSGAPEAMAASFNRMRTVIEAAESWPGDEQYNIIFEEALGESATSETFESSLLSMTATGELTGYLEPVFQRLLADKKTSPEAAKQALLKISRILLLYTKLVPARVRHYAA